MKTNKKTAHDIMETAVCIKDSLEMPDAMKTELLYDLILYLFKDADEHFYELYQAEMSDY